MAISTAGDGLLGCLQEGDLAHATPAQASQFSPMSRPVRPDRVNSDEIRVPAVRSATPGGSAPASTSRR